MADDVTEPTDEQLATWRREAVEEGARLRAAEAELSRPLLELALVLRKLGATGATIEVEGIRSPVFAHDNKPISAEIRVSGIGVTLRT